MGRERLAMAHARFALVSLFALGSLTAIGCSESHGVPSVTGDSGPGVDDASFFRDAAPTDASSIHDALNVLDSAMPPSCDAQDAHAMICPVSLCDGLDSWAWDGERCLRIDCGACVGADCRNLVHSQALCESNHASCEPELCRTSGGEWMFWAAECGNYHCGQPVPANCLVGRPACDCSNGRSFDVARGGCFVDPSCPAIFPPTARVMCTSSGGTWTPGICCATRCGQRCADPCAADACACGPLQVFDPVRGCIDDAACHVRTGGEVCSAQIRCADGLICCERCGGAGCDPVMHCQAPVCSTDPNIDQCGNNRLAP